MLVQELLRLHEPFQPQQTWTNTQPHIHPSILLPLTKQQEGAGRCPMALEGDTRLRICFHILSAQFYEVDIIIAFQQI
jgi:hypothetical protein